LKFSGGRCASIHWLTNQAVKRLCGHLEEEYLQMAPGSQYIGYIAKHLRYQNIPTNNNYWYLGEEVILFN
jgi:hypothetical protein